MKKAIVLVLGLVVGACQFALAETPTAAGSVLTHNDSGGYGVHKSVGSDWSGNTGTGMLVTTINGSGGAAGATTITSVGAGVSITVNNTAASAVPVVITNTSVPVTCATCATAANQTTMLAGLAVSVTSRPCYGTVSNKAYTVLTSTATSIQLGAYTGATRTCDVAVSCNYGANSAIRFAITTSSTAPSDLSSRGNYLAATATTQILGPFSSDTTWYLHMYSIGTGPTGNDVTPYVYGYTTNTAAP